MNLNRIEPDKGLLYYLINLIKPSLGKIISQTGQIQTMIVGLGSQGMRHAKLMMDYGTTISCGVSPGMGSRLIHESIPVFETVSEAMNSFPNIAVASIWRHYSTAKDATIDVIRSGIPIIVLITEGIPLRDVREIILEARNHNTLLFGGNTPGIIFPPERIKIGMLPNVFHPEEIKHNKVGSKGVTIISRSGAILYHLSDALASAGIAQNAVLGIGGDGAIGSRFIDIVPKIIDYENTDLLVIAGEIGGIQEEFLARDIKENPKNYPKQIVALISGANAPEGKTMGHAGAIIAPRQNYGTYLSKKSALEAAGVIVVNHQRDLIEIVKTKLNSKEYFKPEVYYKRMKELWDEKPPLPVWSTLITNVMPNNLIIRGFPLQEIIATKNLIEIAYLVIIGDFPSKEILIELEKIAKSAILEKGPPKISMKVKLDENLSKIIGLYILQDEALIKFNQNHRSDPDLHSKKLVYTLGRVIKYLSLIFNNDSKLYELSATSSFAHYTYTGLTGDKNPEKLKVSLIEAMISACVDHGVTPPSAQTTRLLASTRALYEVSIVGGINTITDVHGGAGTKAAYFFKKVVKIGENEQIPIEDATYRVMESYIKAGLRIEGLGHRIHTQDPRRDILWNLVENSDITQKCVSISKIISTIFYRIKGMKLPINVDGVIGAIVADMELDPIIAKSLFIFGRIIGLSAHYFEEIETQLPMRQLNFEYARYKGPTLRHINS